MTRISTRVSLCCASAIMLVHTAPAFAQTVVDADSSTPLVTSVDGDITINADVTLEVTGADPITIDSDNSLSVLEDGAITADATGEDGRNGVVVNAGTNATITNAGLIQVSEDFVPEDDDGDGRPDGAIAQASNRHGLLVNSTTGTITNTGIILVEGLDSVGVGLADGWAGSFNNTDGTIAIIGDNSVALSTQSIAGDLRVSGTLAAVGAGAQVLVVDGDVGGSLVIDGTLTKSRSYTNDDGTAQNLSRSALRVAAPAVEITGNVAGGILVNAPPLNLDSENDDEDGDGILDADETTGVINSFGEAPALLIGSANDITIGGGTARNGTFSLGLDGDVTATGFFSTFDATAVVIGGQGGSVDLTDGIGVGGEVTAVTIDSNAVAILINSDVNAPTLFNSGRIIATISSPGEGSAVGVRDFSGTLAEVNNTGFIVVSGAAEDETVALDLSNNTSGVVVNQFLSDADQARLDTQVAADDFDPDSPTIFAGISGDILTGSGNDLLDIQNGAINGDTLLGLGDDTVLLSGFARYVGDIDPGMGAFTMTLSDNSRFIGELLLDGATTTLTLNDEARFRGTVQGGEALTAQVNGGLLQASDGETLAFDTLNVGADGSIGIIINTEDETNSTFLVNNATFADGASVDVEIGDVLGAEGNYLVLTSGNLNVAGDLALTTGTLPLIYTADVTNDATTISVNINRQSAADLGLSLNNAAAYDAILATAAQEDGLATSILQAEDVATLEGQFAQLLPDYNGGVFDFVTRSSRLSSRRISDNGGFFDEWPVGAWLEVFYLKGSRDGVLGANYSNSGYGISAGWERKIGNSYIGISGSRSTGSTDTDDYQTTDITKYEAALHFRLWSGPLYAFARAGYINASLDAENTFTGAIDGQAFSLGSIGDWSGSGYTGMAGLSYDLKASDRFTIRPKVVVDYFKFDEDSYQTEAVVDALILNVADRSSNVASANTSLTLAYRLQNQPAADKPMTFEIEGGYRSILSGDAGLVTANFEDGNQFVLTPDSLKGGWNAEARIHAGGWYHAFQLAIGAEQTGGDIDMNARLTINVAF